MINLTAPTLTLSVSVPAELKVAEAENPAESAGFASILALQGGAQAPAPLLPVAAETPVPALLPASEAAKVLPATGKLLPDTVAALPVAVEVAPVSPDAASVAAPPVAPTATLTAPPAIQKVVAKAGPAPAERSNETPDEPQAVIRPEQAFKLAVHSLARQSPKPARGEAAPTKGNAESKAEAKPGEDAEPSDLPAIAEAAQQVVVPLELAAKPALAQAAVAAQPNAGAGQPETPGLAEPQSRSPARAAIAQVQTAPLRTLRQQLPVQQVAAQAPVDEAPARVIAAKAEQPAATASVAAMIEHGQPAFGLAPQRLRVQPSRVAEAAKSAVQPATEAATPPSFAPAAMPADFGAQVQTAPLRTLRQQLPVQQVAAQAPVDEAPARVIAAKAEQPAATASVAAVIEHGQPALGLAPQRLRVQPSRVAEAAKSAVQPATEAATPLSFAPAAMPADFNAQVAAPAPVTAAERPVDFAQLVDRLVAARDALSPQPVSLSLHHADFGKVSLRFDNASSDGSLNVSMSAADPDFARAVAVAAPMQAQASMNGDTPSQRNASDQQQAAPGQAQANQGNAQHQSPRSNSAESRGPARNASNTASPDSGDEQDRARRGLFA